MREKRKIFFGIGIMLILIIGIFLVSSLGNGESNNLKVSGEVYKSLEKQDSVRVIIKLKEPVQEKGFLIKSAKSSMIVQEEKENIRENVIQEVGKENIKHVFDDSIAVEIIGSELEILGNNPNIESITIDKPIHAFLQNSVPLINATGVWPLQISGTNLTGANETICIIDTGINKYHADFQNRVIAEYCYCTTSEGVSANCCPDGTGEDNNATDNNGHGTHVAGIAIANNNIKGVAIDTNIVAVKILNSSGSGLSSDLNAGINWCITNRNNYNISVISLSLGGGLYSNYCDNEASETTLSTIINNATYYNISVIAATGNSESTTQIASPACIQNVTAVGWSDKSADTINANGNRNNLTDLVAPGTSINSTFKGGSCLAGCTCVGNYMICSGTSMSTPHVAGAFAIIRQLYRLQEGRVPTPSEIQNLLNSTGKQINDTGGTNLIFSRIDVYSAVNSILKRVTMTFVSPSNNSFLNLVNQNKTFTCNSTSINSNLTNITFYLWNSTGLVYNLTTNITGTNNQTNFSYNFTIENNYLWNCVAYNNGSFSNSNSNYTITYDVTNPNITSVLASPSSTSATISILTNEDTNYSINYGASASLGSSSNSSSFSTSHSASLTSLSASTIYYYNITICDRAGNCIVNGTNNFTTSAAEVVANNPGGGGGGGGASIKSMTYIPSVSETFSGYTKSLSKDDKIKFTFFDKGAETHTLTINQIGKDYVNLTIQSNPINLKLGIGQSAKLNITDSEYYDLYVKLNSIAGTKADLTIQTISELMSRAPVTGKVIEEGESGKDKNINQTTTISYKERFIYPIGLILIIIGVVILMSKKDKYTENIKIKYKQEFRKHLKPRKLSL